jgi:hypothetical protein
MQKQTPKTKEEARQYAIEWQAWVGEQNKAGEKPKLFESDMAQWACHFYELALKFDLVDEFKENGII